MYLINGHTVSNRGCALVVSNSDETIEFFQKQLIKLGISTIVSTSVEQALNLYLNQQFSYALIDIELQDSACDMLIHEFHAHDTNESVYTPVIILASAIDNDQLNSCKAAGSDGFLFKPFTEVELNAQIASLDQIRELKKLYINSINEQLLANLILSNALEERSIHIDEIGLFNKSYSIFSGDLFLIERHQNGNLNVLIADFTGHGLSASIGALPVADAFSAMTKKGLNLKYIIESINNKLHTLLPPGMFMACTILSISSTLRHVETWNGGMPDIYFIDHKTGRIKNKVSSSHIPLGIRQSSANRFGIKTTDITITPGDQIILYTDGLTDALNTDSEMFGTQRLEQCIQQHGEHKFIFTAIIDAFYKFCKNVPPADDITLACIPCSSSIMHTKVTNVSHRKNIDHVHQDSWCWHMELDCSNLRETDPVPTVIDKIHQISGHLASLDQLSNIMYSLYKNVIQSVDSEDYTGTSTSGENNTTYIMDTNIFLRIELKKVMYNGSPALSVKMEDSGKQLDLDHLIDSFNNEIPVESEITPVYDNISMSSPNGTGNKFEIIIYDHTKKR